MDVTEFGMMTIAWQLNVNAVGAKEGTTSEGATEGLIDGATEGATEGAMDG